MKDTHKMLKAYKAKTSKCRDIVDIFNKNVSVEEYSARFEAKSAKNVQKAEKTRKKALKATNDTELRRRAVLYDSKKPTVPTPNPNTAFVNKKLSNRTTESVGAVPKAFYVPPRYGNLYRSLLEEGHSIIHAKRVIRGYMADEEDDTKVVTKSALNDLLDGAREPVVFINRDCQYDKKGYLIKDAPSKKVREQIWNPKTGRYEYDVEE